MRRLLVFSLHEVFQLLLLFPHQGLEPSPFALNKHFFVAGLFVIKQLFVDADLVV